MNTYKTLLAIVKRNFKIKNPSYDSVPGTFAVCYEASVYDTSDARGFLPLKVT